nr:acyltransferase [uncultured Sellimonas sp.]
MKDKKKRYIYIDVLNIFACLCVIFMHCNGIAHIYSDTRAWKESMAVETLAYWAVPVFFMISGATLLGYRDKYTTGVFFKKRILKTVIPFFIWILINLALKVATGKMEMEGGVRGIVNMFTNTTTEHVYWFFIPLFMVYLSLPVVSVLKDYKKLLVYMTAMAFLIYSVYPVTCTLLKIPINGYIQFPAAGGYLLFVLLGYLISTTEMSRKTRLLLYVLGIAGAVIRYGTTLVWSGRSGSLNQTFWGYMNFPSVFLAAAVFVAVKYMPWDKILASDKAKKITASLAGTGFGVYLMHMIVYRTLQTMTGLSGTSYTWRFCMPFVIYGICVCIVLVLKKIPVLKHIVP